MQFIAISARIHVYNLFSVFITFSSVIDSFAQRKWKRNQICKLTEIATECRSLCVCECTFCACIDQFNKPKWMILSYDVAAVRDERAHKMRIMIYQRFHSRNGQIASIEVRERVERRHKHLFASHLKFIFPFCVAFSVSILQEVDDGDIESECTTETNWMERRHQFEIGAQAEENSVWKKQAHTLRCRHDVEVSANWFEPINVLLVNEREATKLYINDDDKKATICGMHFSPRTSDGCTFSLSARTIWNMNDMNVLRASSPSWTQV